jgi:hypothetical protein
MRQSGNYIAVRDEHWSRSELLDLLDRLSVFDLPYPEHAILSACGNHCCFGVDCIRSYGRKAIESVRWTSDRSDKLSVGSVMQSDLLVGGRGKNLGASPYKGQGRYLFAKSGNGTLSLSKLDIPDLDRRIRAGAGKQKSIIVPG